MAYLRSVMLAILLASCAPSAYRYVEPVTRQVCVRSETFDMMRAYLFLRGAVRQRTLLTGMNAVKCWPVPDTLLFVRVQIFGTKWYQDTEEWVVPRDATLWVDIRRRPSSLVLNQWLEYEREQ